MHFYLLNSPNGVSLERLNGYSGDPENAKWHSAASTVGFATPGFTNSHWVGENPGSGKLTLLMKSFLPITMVMKICSPSIFNLKIRVQF
ncbi:MAG: hypothetical protein IPN61_14365 [Bacteroidetes bacterium]|nr:hypothetical protein [Bacteroidota bacterium]